jgi:hypothetical protein
MVDLIMKVENQYLLTCLVWLRTGFFSSQKKTHLLAETHQDEKTPVLVGLPAFVDRALLQFVREVVDAIRASVEKARN